MSTTGFIALTDPDWHSFLARQSRVDEVNFWQPNGGRAFRAVEPGAPFFFKLRAPQRRIAGFGFFQRHEVLPARLAWEAFGPMNGAPTFEELLDRLRRLRSGDQSGREDFSIGCIMLASPVFFPESDWVDPPADWPVTGVQVGKRYDVTLGEGRRVFDECMARALISSSKWNVDRVHYEGPRFGSPVQVKPRLGQGLFSFAVRDAYEGACAVTREHSVPVLEAAHIMPYALGGEHRLENGLLLRSDLHKLFDAGYVTVTPDYEFRVGESLRETWQNGKTYYAMDRTKIAMPKDGLPRPDPALLHWHREKVFLG